MGVRVGETVVWLKYGFSSPKSALPVQKVGLLYLLFEGVYLMGLADWSLDFDNDFDWDFFWMGDFYF